MAKSNWDKYEWTPLRDQSKTIRGWRKGPGEQEEEEYPYAYVWKDPDGYSIEGVAGTRSFYGGPFMTPEKAMEHLDKMISENV